MTRKYVKAIGPDRVLEPVVYTLGEVCQLLRTNQKKIQRLERAEIGRASCRERV